MRNVYFNERYRWNFYLVGILYLHLTVAKDACDKYKNEPESAWPSLPKFCREYLQNQIKNPAKYFPADTATQSTVTSGSEPPLNFGEREVEIEIETEGKNKQKERDSEMELEIDSESDYEMELECLGKACQKDSKGESDKTDRSQSSRLHLELLRTIAVLCMTAVAVLTIIVLATAIFCVLKRRENRRNNQEERKDLGRRHVGGHRGYHGENKESPSIGNIPINQSQNNEPKPGGLQQRPLVEYHEATPVSSRRHSPAVMATPTRGEPEYSLVVETQYASIDDDVIASGTAKGHYYFKLDSEASKYSQQSVRSAPNSQPSDLSARTLLPPSTPSRESPLSGSLTNSQYDHLDHSGNHRTPTVATGGTCYDVLDLK